MILQDPHWTPPQRFTKVVPLWPQEMKPGWSGFYRTRYQVVGFPDNDFYWGLTIQANAWNRIKTQAGEFDALYYVNTADYFESDDFVAQVRQALANIQAVLAEAGAEPQHITRMTWYVLDKKEYLARGREVGQAYREVLGTDYAIAMSAVQVSALMEDRALVEIEVTAVVPG